MTPPPAVAAAQIVTVSEDEAYAAMALLTVEEKRRIERLKSEPRKLAMLRTIAARRIWLAKYLSISPEAIILEQDDAGMPLLNGFAAGEVSFSRSAEWCAIALANGRRVGIDLEFERDMNWSSVLDFLSLPDEANQIRSAVKESGELTPFFRAWCTKEAVLKLTGKGLKAGPKTLTLPNAAIEGENAVEFTIPLGVIHVRIAEIDSKVIALATMAA
ncbi:MAG: 4'-phosphopantetheinyl transferase superfamily protein [Pseudomonadota bacterium]